jgi:predicted aspartyl protease
VTINGKPANYLLDTGAWLSVMTEGEAKRLGLVIREGTGVLSDASGKGTKVRTAVASDLSLGAMSFHNVSFAILPDVEPFRSMEVGRGGILGIPILLEVGCVRWVKGGTWELGCATASSRDSANLVFFENQLLVAATVSGTSGFGVLDTGAETTDLNANFARQFADALARNGVKDTTTIAGVGGTTATESVTLPTLDFDIGGTQVALRPAHVTMQRTSALGGKCCVGNIGLDLLLQTGALTIDFKTMTLRLR